LNEEVVYIGRAIELFNGGFRKRLADYRRNSESARKHASGQKMFNNREHLEIDILVTGVNTEAIEVAKARVGWVEQRDTHRRFCWVSLRSTQPTKTSEYVAHFYETTLNNKGQNTVSWRSITQQYLGELP
jgi:hypothetical protein